MSYIASSETACFWICKIPEYENKIKNIENKYVKNENLIL